jgi:hypothetical protein
MRIFTKKVFGFRNPRVSAQEKLTQTATDAVIVTKKDEFQDVPGWVKDDQMFIWGVADGDIEVVAAPVAVKVDTSAADKAAK